jgi:hypothetical protein
MNYDKVRDQWFSTPPFKFGVSLLGKIYPNKIPAGTVMTFYYKERPYIMFQILLDISCSIENRNLVYYEPGSIVFLGAPSRVLPALRFSNCRMPTLEEYVRYMESFIV